MIGRFSRCAVANASAPHGYQSTGLCACCRRYGLLSWIRRLVCSGTCAPSVLFARSPRAGEAPAPALRYEVRRAGDRWPRNLAGAWRLFGKADVLVEDELRECGVVGAAADEAALLQVVDEGVENLRHA